MTKLTKPRFRMPMRFVLVGISALSIFLSACNDDDNNGAPERRTIVQRAQSTTELNSLTAALSKFPDLVSTLEGSGQYTVFAPSNEAFAQFLSAVGQESIDDVPDDVLRAVLEYHVVASRTLRSNQLSNGELETVLGEPLVVNTSSGVSINGSANVVTADVEASNGVVHIVNAVLVPVSIRPIVGTVVAPAYFNKQFSILVSAVSQAGLLQTLLDPSANFTVFAPTNEAFAAAGITALPPNNASGNAQLTSILQYHVLGSAVQSGNLPESGVYSPVAVETLGGKVYLTNRGNGVFLNGNTEVVATDIGATNGVVHVINRTLVPPAQTIAGTVSALSTAAQPQFTQLAAALSRIPALLQAADNASATLTVFAPTDEAFQNLYDALDVSGLDELVSAIGTDGLAKVLQHHIVSSVVFSSDLESGDVPTLSGEDLTIDVSSLIIVDGSNGSSSLVPASLNVHATNGVIHVIDRVLIPTL